MLHFTKAGKSDELHEGYAARSLSLTLQDSSGTREIALDLSGYLQDFSEFGTGLYSDQEVKVGGELELELNLPQQEAPAGNTRLQVMWSRLQDPDNITGICIRQMIFGKYEDQGQQIEPEILRLLHNPSRDSTAGLIQHFSIFSKESLYRLDELKKEYLATHPRTKFRYGAKVMDEGLRVWQQVVNQIVANFAPGEPEEQAESEVMKQFNRRQARR